MNNESPAASTDLWTPEQHDQHCPARQGGECIHEDGCKASSAACTCAEHEACSDPGCRGPYYTEVEFWTRTAVPSDAELRKVVVRDADS